MNVVEKAYHSPVGRFVVRKAGLKDPPKLRRGRVLPAGPVVLGEVRPGTEEEPGAGLVRRTMALVDVPVAEALRDVPELRVPDDKGRAQPPRYDTAPGAIIVDATRVRAIGDLEEIRQLLRPIMRSLEPSGRVIMVATDARDVDGWEAHAVAQALDGINRSVGKELRGGSTANLIFVRVDTRPSDLASTISFLLEGRSAFVSGQTWRVGRAQFVHELSDRPFDKRVVVVTGAARGIGEQIARVFARDGATVVCIDLPQSGAALAAVANQLGGSALQLDITSPEAGRRIAEHVARVHGAATRIWAIVHNAGILRDKLLANTDEKLWAPVLEVNLAAEMRVNDFLLNNDVHGGLGEEARIVGLSSTTGVAGNRGQTNYAASKAGIIGAVRVMAEDLRERGITVNAVAPGFIETDMTNSIPFVQREIFRRTNSLQQGGKPIDVAETLAYLCDPASGAVTGQVIRICGQNVIGQ